MDINSTIVTLTCNHSFAYIRTFQPETSHKFPTKY